MSVPPDSTSARPVGESGRIAYTVAEVAKLLGKHSNMIYEWVGRGALPSEKIGGTIYVPKWALARLVAPDADATSPVAAPVGGEAA
jgi:excisionase family DNA binding protein